MDELDPGTILGGKYRVERLIAQGGMSRLYRGHPLQGAGRVAIKQLDVPANGTVALDDLEQFQKEYVILYSLQHPGLANAVDYFEEDGRHYLVEEFVPGETLEAHVQAAGKLAADEAVSIMGQLLRVLEYLHGHQVIYRDLKPQNVILQPRPCDEDDEPSSPSLPYVVRLVDFGAARRWRRDATADTIALGTPGYAPPEQYGKAQSDERSDIYGAGALLHYMLTGCPPDPARGWAFEAPHKLVPGIPPTLGQAVLQAVQLEPAQRFQHAEDMRIALLRAVGHLPHCPQCGQELPEDGQSCHRCATRRSRPSVGFVLAVTAMAGLLLAILLPNFTRARASGRLTACRSNLRNIGTALEMYSTDNNGQFPARLNALKPDYFPKGIPTCPSVGSDTYSDGYVGATRPDAYTVVCRGSNHTWANQEENFPQWMSTGAGGTIVQ